MTLLTRAAPKAAPNPTPQIKPISTINVDSKVEHRRTLLTHVEGSKWIVQYFHQHTTKDSELAAQELGRSASYQQYLRVIDFELRVTSPLSPSLDTEAQEFSHVGESTVFPGVLVPLKGDMLIADIGDGRAGILIITGVEQLSVLRDSGYRINYGLKGYATGLELEDLNQKVIKTGYFIKDFIAIGKNPILIDSEYDILKDLKEWLARVPEDYFTNFFSHEYKTIMIPDQIQLTYDPFIVEFLSKCFSFEKHPSYLQLKVLNCDLGQAERYETIWDALETLSQRPLLYGRLEMAVCSSASFKQHPRFGTIRYSGIPLFLQPKGAARTKDVETDWLIKPSDATTISVPVQLEHQLRPDDLAGIQLPNDPLGSAPYTILPIYGLPHLQHYVFSQAFYQQDVRGMSLIEQMVYKRLNGNPIDPGQLLRLCYASLSWKSLERFYYQPVLYVLAMAAIGDIN